MTTPTAPRVNDSKCVDLARLVDLGVTVEAALVHLDWKPDAAENALRGRDLRPDIVTECRRLRAAIYRARAKATSKAAAEHAESTDRIIRLRIHRLSEARDPESRIRVAELRLLHTALTRKAAS